ncbi:hypothetical protein [Peterkaempfera griseoplana]|uniref:hypothetical protein n=1 Tax=Peterkaempfera griseoplana TaxID=66896 RepID=UPI0006E32454|nr:hypothetical protein [Peterkaempfera griseoplana]
MTSSTRRRLALAATAATTALGACLATALPAQAAATAAWSTGAVPVDQASLLGVTAVDSHTTWAVGVQLTQSGKATVHTPLLVGRDDRDGLGWRRIPTPADQVSGSRLNAVSAASADDVWLTGDSDDTGILTEHWDGAAWQTVRAPVQPNNGAGFLGVAAVSPADAWAVGWATAADESGDFAGLLEHWDGSAWKALPLPGSGTAVLNTVTAVSAHDVWAAGFDTGDQPVLLHYDGAAWKQLPRPPVAGLYGEVNALTADGPDDVWAVGRVLTSETDHGHALVLHWNGSSWRQVKAPAQAGPLSSAAVAPGGLLAVGMDTTQEQGIAVRWNEGAARLQPLPAADGASDLPAGVEVSGRTATAVGAAAVPGQPGLAPLLVTGRL